MTLVKIKIDRKCSGYLQKYLVELIPQIHHTVKDFLKMTRQVLDIDWPLQQIVILKSGYTLPHSLSSRIFSKSQNSSFKIMRLADQIVLNVNAQASVNTKSKAKLIKSSSISQSQQSNSQSQQVGLKYIKKKAAQKIRPQPISRKISIQNQQQSQQSQQNIQQSSQQSSELPVIDNKKRQLKQKKLQKSKILSQVRKQSSSQESQSNSSLKLQVKKNKAGLSNSKNVIKNNQTNKNDLKIISLNQQAKKQKKKIIQMDSSSQESSQQQKLNPIDSKNNQKILNKSTIAAKNNANRTKIPPSVRQKYQKNTFKTHQQQQWIQISKQILKKHYQSQQNKTMPFLKINNLIRFKIIQLDEQRFVPVSSQWIEGTVSSVTLQGKIILSKVIQINRPFRQTYQIFQHNMLQIQINRNFILKQQALFISQQKPQQNLLKSPEQNNVQNQQSKKQEDKCSLQKFICGQVNFYFSDKNYPTDLFMRMHANNHPQKYFPIRVMLNFPKIKKMLKDQNKLFEYLLSDQKKNQRNFQLDQANRLIRKKNYENTKENVAAANIEEKRQEQINHN